jgi:hypothetical protein
MTLKTNLTPAQETAIRCAVLDLIGAVEVHRAQDPFVQLEESAVLDTLDELKAAFPDAFPEGVEIPR